MAAKESIPLTVRICGVIAGISVLAATVHAQSTVIRLWDTSAPGSEHRPNTEQRIGNHIVNVSQPDLTLFSPVHRDVDSSAVLVFPGGGYRQVEIEKEGYDVARWLAENGMTAFVLKYRLNSRDTALLDAQRAVSLVRRRAKEYGIRPDRIGTIGFSAGGHLEVNLAGHPGKAVVRDQIDSTDCRPDFMIVAYAGSIGNLSGEVNEQFPPVFIVHAADDARAPVSQSVDLFTALHTAGVPAELHVYEQGKHGFALLKDRGAVKSWAGLCIDWLKARGLLRSY